MLLERQLANSERRIAPQLIARFGEMMRERLRGDDPSLRQYYARAIISRVEVGNEQIRIVGANKALEHALGRTADEPTGLVPNIERDVRLQYCCAPSREAP